MGAAHTVCHTTATAPRQPMAALARGLGAACRISVARLRPAESDVRSMSSTRSKTVGAVRHVRGGAEAGFWVVCWVARGGAASLPALIHKSTTCVIHTGPPARAYGRPIWQTHLADPSGRPIGYMCYAESVKPDLEVFTTFRLHHFQTDERAIAALLLSPPSVIALRPIRIVMYTSKQKLKSIAIDQQQDPIEYYSTTCTSTLVLSLIHI